VRPAARVPQQAGGPAAPQAAGTGGRGFVRRHPLGSYLTGALLLSWGYWILLALAGGEGSHVPGLLGPAVAAVVISAVIGGRREVGVLLGRVGRWRVGLRWYVVALAPLAGAALGVAILAAAGSGPTRAELAAFPGLPTVGWLGIYVLALLVNGFGEEIGWRGFAWPRLRERRSIAAAAGVLAVPWALWHVPTFWLATGLDLEPFVIPGWLLGLVAGGVVLGTRTGRRPAPAPPPGDPGRTEG
jgi:uncharacterized protein